MADRFILTSRFKPQGDQPQAIKKLTESITRGNKYQTLLGVTGSGKTFTLACVIEKINRPVLVISHNKTLAAQLYAEFKGFFPKNAVEYFVSYYDYYQPEAYIPQTDTYIEKDASINERIERLRLSATSSLSSRRDVLVVASVSCIYNLGSPDDYRDMVLFFEKGQSLPIFTAAQKLVSLQYVRSDTSLERGKFRLRGDVLDIYPAYKKSIIRIEFFGDEIDSILELDPVSYRRMSEFEKVSIYPAKHFLVSSDRITLALKTIAGELDLRVEQLKKQGKNLEAQRLLTRTRYDMEMLKECGWCHGIENYSRHLSQRPAGSRPYCLLDYFPRDYLVIIDESHITIPQIRGMYNGDRARKQVLVDHGFRLESCLDNRPLKYEEFISLSGQIVFASATPSVYEIRKSGPRVIEQVIRPTGLLDPLIEVRPTQGQVQDLIREVRLCAGKKQRVLVTTLTKKMSEDLSAYLEEEGLKVQYIHSDLDTIERAKIIQDLRRQRFDCLVGINLLREGIDLPEVSLVAILDADKEGFLRSSTSLIQVAGRAARNVDGRVIMYADRITKSMQTAIEESGRRRKKQLAYNKKHNIVPETIEKAIKEGIETLAEAEEFSQAVIAETPDETGLYKTLSFLEKEMFIAARNLKFEKAAEFRDRIKQIKETLNRG